MTESMTCAISLYITVGSMLVTGANIWTYEKSVNASSKEERFRWHFLASAYGLLWPVTVGATLGVGIGWCLMRFAQLFAAWVRWEFSRLVEKSALKQNNQFAQPEEGPFRSAPKPCPTCGRSA